MKILIAFYSKTRGTEKLAEVLKEEFEKRGHEVDMEKVLPQKEHSFWGWWFLRMIFGSCRIKPLKIPDVSAYDLICVGSPNWTKISLPMAEYIRTVKGIRYKKVAFFSTTMLIPTLEWLVFSAYYLDYSFNYLVQSRAGRVIDNLLLSVFFKNWSMQSKYGQEKIKKFCDNVVKPITSFKEYFLEQDEIQNARVLVVLFSFFLLFAFLLQIDTLALGYSVFTWEEFFNIFAIGLFAYFSILSTLAARILVPLGKFLANFSLLVGFTIGVMFLELQSSLPIIGGFFLISIIFSLFRSLRIAFFNAFLIYLAYFFLYLNYYSPGILYPLADLIVIFLNLAVLGFVTQRLQKHHSNALEVQDDVEMANASLEIKIRARTEELRNLTVSLEDQVKERTKELNTKIRELEAFNKIAIGRELKMVELKDEIKKLKEENVQVGQAQAAAENK